MRLPLLITLIIFLVSACHGNFSQNSSSQEAPSPLAATRVVKHALGETRIPVNPQRVVALHERNILDPVLALGIKPVGAVEIELALRLPASADQLAGIEGVGSVSEPNLEKMLLLKPDLILAVHQLHKAIYKQLSEIAPTVIVPDPDRLISFKDRFRWIAQVLGRNEEAERVLAQYQARVEEFKRVMGKRSEEIEVSVIEFEPTRILTYGPDSTVGQVFKDAGLRRPPAQEKLSESTENLLQKTLSLEVIGEHDADVLFLIEYPNVGAESYLNSPIWSQLSAVQNRRVYQVGPERWSTRGPLGANAILDDLFRYLVEEAK